MAFAHAVREGSFSRAASRLGVSQSAVSQQVGKLEAQLGTALLIREREGLRLTRSGQDIFELSEKLLTVAQSLDDRIDGMTRLEKGHLTIIANSPRPALKIIGAYKQKHPGVEIDFGLWDWTTSMRLVRQRQCDIAIVTEPRGLGACAAEQVERVAYVAHMPPDHPLAAHDSVSLHDLSRGTVLLPEEGSFTRRVVARKLAEAWLAFPSVMQTTSFPLMKEAALHRVGVGIFLEGAMHESTSLATRPIREMPETYGTFIVYPQDKAHLRLVQTFLDTGRAPAA